MIYDSPGEFFSAIDHIAKDEPPNTSLAKITRIFQNNPQILQVNANAIKAQELIAPAFKITQLSPAQRVLAFRIFNLTGLTENSKVEPHWKDSPQSRWEIEQYRIALGKDPEFSQNFEFVSVPGNSNSYLGRGREGIVFLARQIEDGRLMAVKAQCEREPDIHGYNGAEEVAAVDQFSRATGYSFEASNFQNFNAKTYIQGKSLQTLLESNEFFRDKEMQGKMYLKLEELLHRLIEAKVFFADIAPENFVFDGSNFFMIDLRPYQVCATPEEAREKYRQAILGNPDTEGSISWLQDRWYHADCNREDKNDLTQLMNQVLG